MFSYVICCVLQFAVIKYHLAYKLTQQKRKRNGLQLIFINIFIFQQKQRIT